MKIDVDLFDNFVGSLVIISIMGNDQEKGAFFDRLLNISKFEEINEEGIFIYSKPIENNGVNVFFCMVKGDCP